MSAQTELRPDIEIGNKPGSNKVSREPGGTRKPHRVLWLIVLFIAMVLAGVIGVTVAANLTDPAVPTQVVYPVPNANAREGRVPARRRTPTSAKAVSPRSAVKSRNANDREGRVSDSR